MAETLLDKAQYIIRLLITIRWHLRKFELATALNTESECIAKYVKMHQPIFPLYYCSWCFYKPNVAYKCSVKILILSRPFRFDIPKKKK